MTRQTPHQTDLKKGSADTHASGDKVGMPGQHIADGESLDADANDAATQAGAGDATRADPKAAAKTGKDRTIPEQAGCGPNVTDYPGLSDDTPARH